MKLKSLFRFEFVAGAGYERGGRQKRSLDVESDFRLAMRAHPGFVVSELDKVREDLIACGVQITDDDFLSGARRFASRLWTVKLTNPRELAFDLGRESATPA